MLNLEDYVRIKSKRVCHKHIYGKIGEIFGYGVRSTGTVVYGVSLDGKDYDFYEYELEKVEMDCKKWWEK